MPSVYHNMISLISRCLIRRNTGGLVYIEMHESGAANYHVFCCHEVNQPHAVVGCFFMKAEFSDGGAKYIFPSDFSIKTPGRILMS